MKEPVAIQRCDQCDWTKETTPHGLTMHKSRNHPKDVITDLKDIQRRNDRERKARERRARSNGHVDPDQMMEVFAKVAAATRALFPDPEDVYTRLDEIVELRKHMIRVLSR